MTQIIEARAGWRAGFVVPLDRDEVRQDPERSDRHNDRRGKREKPEPARAAAPERLGADRAAESAHQVRTARRVLYIEPPITNYGRTA